MEKENNDHDYQIFDQPFTDSGNAFSLSLLYGDQLRYVHKVGWHVWNGAHWQRDNDDQTVEYYKQLARLRQQIVLKLADDKEREEMMREAFHLENRAKIDNCLKVAQSLKPFSCLPEQLDRDAMLMACPNSTIDLRTGNLIPANPDDLITQRASVKYKPGAKTVRFEWFWGEIFIKPDGSPDYDLIDWIQKALGYCLTGDIIMEKVLYIMYGGGDNGKTTLLLVILDILGTYAATTPFNTFLETNHQASKGGSEPPLLEE